MPTSKVAITIDSELLKELDQMITRQVFPNRSRAVPAALEDKLARLKRTRLAVTEIMNERSTGHPFDLPDRSALEPVVGPRLCSYSVAARFPVWPAPYTGSLPCHHDNEGGANGQRH